ncbi:MAG TPA: hypothetical protein VKF79_07585, partial [Candidatus Acidoferrum sp.]|nr:hypothetical protein [Candidatus Acidoferrum sp.]
ACLLHAQDLLSTTPGDELSAVAQARGESEERLGRAVATKIRSDINLELQKVLSLPTPTMPIGK